MISEVFNEDCMVGMKRYPDKYFDLAIVDPPYGIGIAKKGKVGGEKCAKVSEYTPSEWDSDIPKGAYFNELMRVSKNQIIWGGNYMIEHLINTPCFVIWDKNNTGNFADAELAWTSFKTPTRIFRYTWNGMLQENMKDKEERIHPTQKPVQLYKWLLKNYAKEGNSILDTHLGSGSSRIACYSGGFDFVGFEINSEYYVTQEKRFELFKRQLVLF
jgi:site-specific DNA-methyltransferase (adenine-specific)